MAMNGAMLGQQIANLIIDPKASPQSRAQITALWQQIATQIVLHIQTQATITIPPIVVTPQDIIGTSVAGPVTNVGVINMSVQAPVTIT